MYAVCTALAVAASSSTMVSFICSVFCFLFILDSRQQSEFINQRGGEERRERRKLEARKKQKIHFFSPVMLNIDEARSTISISRLPPLFYSIHFFSCVSVNNK
jgi:hypothetical protein